MTTGAEFEVFFDGECPLCVREINLLRRMDRRERLVFTDIADPAFEPWSIGRSRDQLMARIHGRGADGVLVEGVEVFRRLYAAVGFGPLVALSRWRPVAALLDGSYGWFARNRLRITGRCTNETCAPRIGVNKLS